MFFQCGIGLSHVMHMVYLVQGNISFLNTNNYTYPSKRILVDLDNFKISKSIENDRVNWLSTLYVTYSIPLITSSSFYRANLYIPLRMIWFSLIKNFVKSWGHWSYLCLLIHAIPPQPPPQHPTRKGKEREKKKGKTH